MVIVELRLTRHGASLRVGRIFLRTWPPCTSQLPKGYVSVMPVYLGERFDERDGNTAQLGGFTTMEAAEACLAQLEAEDRRDLHINLVSIHQRVSDWRDDR